MPSSDEEGGPLAVEGEKIKISPFCLLIYIRAFGTPQLFSFHSSLFTKKPRMTESPVVFI